MFETLYASPWLHPGIAFLAAAAFALVRARRQSFVAAWTTIFLLEIVADAMVTGGFAPVPKGSLLERNLGITFVILGDFRYFLLVEAFLFSRAAPHGLGPPKTWVTAALLAFVVPVASLVHQRIMPGWFENGRHVFLGYELMMVVFLVALRATVLRRRLRAMPGELAAWLDMVTLFVIVQYALWATADVIILGGHDWGFLLRTVPNGLYYGAFVPFVFLSAPGSARAT